MAKNFKLFRNQHHQIDTTGALLARVDKFLVVVMEGVLGGMLAQIDQATGDTPERRALAKANLTAQLEEARSLRRDIARVK